MTNEQISDIVMTIRIQIDNEFALYRKRVDELQKIMRMIQNSCPHEKTTYVPDASGNNDSYSYCDACRIEKKEVFMTPQRIMPSSPAKINAEVKAVKKELEEIEKSKKFEVSKYEFANSFYGPYLDWAPTNTDWDWEKDDFVDPTGEFYIVFEEGLCVTLKGDLTTAQQLRINEILSECTKK